MLFKILSTMLRDFIAGLVMAVGCCCMMVGQAFVKAAVCLAPGCVQGQWGEM